MSHGVFLLRWGEGHGVLLLRYEGRGMACSLAIQMRGGAWCTPIKMMGGAWCTPIKMRGGHGSTHIKMRGGAWCAPIKMRGGAWCAPIRNPKGMYALICSTHPLMKHRALLFYSETPPPYPLARVCDADQEMTEEKIVKWLCRTHTHTHNIISKLKTARVHKHYNDIFID